MEPIVSPWLIYFIEMTTGATVILGGFAAVTLFFACICFSPDATKEERKCVKSLLIVGIVFALLFMIIPRKETCYKMLIASYVTMDNIKEVKDGVKLDVRDIVKAIVEPVSDAIIKVQKEGK